MCTASDRDVRNGLVTVHYEPRDIELEIRRVFDNLKAIAEAAGATLAQVAKLTVFVTDLAHFPKINEIMATYFAAPYPARAVVGVAQLPRGARVESECILSLG